MASVESRFMGVVTPRVYVATRRRLGTGRSQGALDRARSRSLALALNSPRFEQPSRNPTILTVLARREPLRSGCRARRLARLRTTGADPSDSANLVRR